MKKVLIGLAVLVVLVVAAALIAPFVIPTDTVRKELLAQIETATGREARIDGDFSVSLLPRVQVVAGDFSLANAPGGAAKNMVELDRLQVRVALFPLIGGRVEIDSFVLNEPKIALEVDRNGRPNWEFKPAKPPGAAAPAEPDRPAAGGDGDGGGGLAGLSLGDVRLVGGRLSYTDTRTGETQAVEAINATVSLPSLADPLKADGALVWNGEKISLKATVAAPGAFLDGKQTALEADIESAPVKLAFKGTASSGAEPVAAGTATLDVPSIRKLAAWAGSPLDAPGTGFGPLKISGAVDVRGQRYAFRDAKIAMDSIAGTGEVSFDGSGRVPTIVGRLDLDTLDVNPYLPLEGAAAPPAGGGTAGGGAGGTAGGAPASAGWSDAPIDLAGLKAVNARFDLTVGGIQVRKIRIGPSALNLALKDGVLVADLSKMALYDGAGKARLTVNGAGAVPAIAAAVDLAGVQANPLLRDAAGFEKLEGTANADFSVNAQGKSQRALVSALSGVGQVRFLDGAIRGINLAAMVRNVTSAFLDPAARETQKTDFAELGGTFTIDRGILVNNDLLLKSPLLRLAGKGTVSLPPRTLNYRLEPQIAATTEGQGGRTDVGGVKVPVVVSGPWDNLSYTPDLTGAIEGIAKDPRKALEGLKNMIPGQGQSSGGSGGGAAQPNPADALKKLFGR